MNSRRKGSATAVLLAGGCALLPVACTAPTPTCSAGHLIGRLELAQGAAGSHYETWQLINSGSTCQLNGWVNAVNVDGSGRPLPTTVTFDSASHGPVVLNPGQHASWFFRYVNPAILGCLPESPAGMLITPPGSHTTLFVRPGEHACNGVVDVSPLVAGG